MRTYECSDAIDFQVGTYTWGCLCERGGCRSVKCTLSAGFLMFTNCSRLRGRLHLLKCDRCVCVYWSVSFVFSKRGHRFVDSFRRMPKTNKKTPCTFTDRGFSQHRCIREFGDSDFGRGGGEKMGKKFCIILKSLYSMVTYLSTYLWVNKLKQKFLMIRPSKPFFF